MNQVYMNLLKKLVFKHISLKEQQKELQPHFVEKLRNSGPNSEFEVPYKKWRVSGTEHSEVSGN